MEHTLSHRLKKQNYYLQTELQHDNQQADSRGGVSLINLRGNAVTNVNYFTLQVYFLTASAKNILRYNNTRYNSV